MTRLIVDRDKPKNWVVAHKILMTSPEAKFFFPFLGLFGALEFGLGLGLGLVNSTYEM